MLVSVPLVNPIIKESGRKEEGVGQKGEILAILWGYKMDV
jgi:hypothetical protein